jgi:hypothetical protein
VLGVRFFSPEPTKALHSPIVATPVGAKIQKAWLDLEVVQCAEDGLTKRLLTATRDVRAWHDAAVQAFGM